MSVLNNATNLLLAADAASGGFQISRSLRFNSADSAYLNWTPASSASSSNKLTYSTWVKRTKLGSSLTEHVGLSAAVSGGSRDAIRFSGDSIDVYVNEAVSGNVTTSAVFRDTSAWYHIVVSIDTTKATAADRIIIYVNGVLQTVTGTQPSQNYNFTGFLVSGKQQNIGRNPQPAYYADSYLAEIYCIDGQALTPASFAETDATTGQWIPKAFSGGSYGTNGFYLKFDDNSTTAALGTDSSGNGNTWTTNNFSVTGGSSSVTFPSSGAPPTVDYLVVGGGGGGYNVGTGAETYGGGGGGAGGLRSTVTATGGGGALETPLSITAGASYTVTVGAGGASSTSGSPSVFGSIVALGGGTGSSGNNVKGPTGGSGGGESAGNNPIGSSYGDGTAGQGFRGGSQSSNYFIYGVYLGGGGGGGGAGSVGGDAPSGGQTGGNGGSGVAVSIIGSSVTYGGGGGGGYSGSGGSGGGGAGGYDSNGAPGTANLGGGGGGASAVGGGNFLGGAGGSGIVIIRYANTYADLTVGGGLTYTYANTGGYKIYSFTASATAAQSAGNDSLVDSPTSYGTGNSGGDVRGNYATLNPLQKGSDLTLSNGNLDLAKSSTVDNCTASTIGMTSGKWYFELTITNLGSGEYAIGFGKNIPIQSYMGSNATTWSYADTGSLATNGSSTSYGSSYTTGDILGAAFDGDNGTLTFYKNGTSQGTAATGLTQGPYFFAVGAYSSAATRSANFGQRAFAYTAPSGFKALVDTNLPTPTIAKGNTVFDATLYTGTGTTNSITSLQFAPDFVWLKSRSSAQDHQLFDIVRGPSSNLYALQSNSTAAEGQYGTMGSLDSTGFTLTGAGGATNGNGTSYVAWTWDAGTSTVTNNSGSISSQVRANLTAGFSVVTFTKSNGSGASSTIGHGLNATPYLIITKGRNVTDAWYTYHNTLGSNGRVQLNESSAATTGTSVWGSTSPTSQVFTMQGVFDGNYLAYCFAPVVGYSSFGSYTGNGSSDGSFVYTGFRPRWILIKSTTETASWMIYDTARDTYNQSITLLYPNLSLQEQSSSNYAYDILSNGFKVRNSGQNNTSSATYIYAAFAESPFNYARAR
jgi:hypothetical protein